GVNLLARLPAMAEDAIGAGLADHRAAEADFVSDLAALEFPRIAEGEPVLGQFDLPAVDDLLAKEAVLVANAVAVRGDADRCHRLHEAGGETAEAAIAERGVGL